MSTASKTLFQEKSDTYQNAQDRTKQAGVTTGLGILGPERGRAGRVVGH